jgi:hypothetical protein
MLRVPDDPQLWADVKQIADHLDMPMSQLIGEAVRNDPRMIAYRAGRDARTPLEPAEAVA